MKIECTVNGEQVSREVDPLRRLLDFLRDDLGLTGTKEGCGEGECGACSVLLNGEVVTSCLIPVAQVSGAEITTIEGARESELGRIVGDAFTEVHGVQCGFCSPGMMIAAMAYLNQADAEVGPAAAESRADGEQGRGGAGSGPAAAGDDVPGRIPALTDEIAIRTALSGNICRCTGYDMIVDAVQLAAERISGKRAGDRERES